RPLLVGAAPRAARGAAGRGVNLSSEQLALYGRRLWPPFALATLLVVTWALVDSFGGTTYQAHGARMFLDLMIVLGLQICSGHSGVLSFGHATFVGFGDYFSALSTIPKDQKTFQFLTMPHWLSSWIFPAQLTPLEAVLAGAGFAPVVAAIFAPPIARL